ncbi:DNA-binding response regulator, LytR/AlgR family [Pilibacter termitis]|uniref:DNA-binding response regulator, LytR/AlgR family n=1 Tax=Pilibacter termitis TaxID=263852 RepID=A0A1T4LFW2_9ENTE|nr:LytTR family DNA-binding domain-containing protein [Pilibacter termitis]SJZ53642.1 DNA-binding response regulator, LytR/AlgR family [Pilibacter termitis]
MLKIVCVSENLVLLERLKRDFHDFQSKFNIPFTVKFFSKPEKLLKKIKDFHLVFIDLEMTQINELGIIKKVKHLNSPLVYILSQKEDLGWESFNSNIFYFLKKDTHLEEKLEPILKNVLEEEKKKSAFLLKDAEKEMLTLVKVEEIDYIEAFAKKSMVMANGKYYDSDFTLKQWESLFEEKHSFQKINRSFIVNFGTIRSITTNEVVVGNGQSISIAVRQQSAIKKAWKKFLMEQMNEMKMVEGVR